MYCLTNLCYVCLETKNNLISSVDSSMSVNKELLDMFGYCAHNLAYLKTKRIILICEECCSRLRETYQFLQMLHKNSAILEGYTDLLNGTTPSNTETEAELLVHLKDNTAVKCEINEEQIYTDECEPSIAEAQDVFVNTEDSLIIEEHTWKKEESDDRQGYPMDNNSIDSKNNESVSEISVNSNTHITNTILNTENEAEPLIQLQDINQVKCEIKDEQIRTDEYEPIIEETQDVFVNTEDSLTIEEHTWKKEELVEREGYPMDNNSTEADSEISTLQDDEICTFNWRPLIKETENLFVDFEESLVKAGIICKMDKVHNQEEYPSSSTESVCNESDSEISVNSNTHITDTDSDSSEFTGKQAAATNKSESNTPANKSHTCSTCSKSFISKKNLKRHTRIHTGEKPYKCDRCDICFRLKHHLLDHMRIHTREKPYKCDRCDKCFSQKSNLERHMRVHTGENPYKCDTCDKCFSQKPHLLNHMRTHTGEKSHKCDTCGKCFSQKHHLLYHMRTHTGESPHKCDRCDKCFSQKSNLVYHMRTHTGEKSYKCDRCDKCFILKSTLVRHMQIHTGEKPYKCDTCDKCFSQKSNLMRHKLTHTGEKI